MKKLLTLAFLFIGIVCFAQADTTIYGDAGTLASGIIALLTHLGVHVPAWVGALVSILLFLLRRWEKNQLKQAHAEEIRQALASSPTMKDEHAGLFKRIIHKLDGKKDPEKK